MGPKTMDAFVKAANKGIVRSINASGITILKGNGIKIGNQIYTHEIKVLNNEYADFRIYGYIDKEGNYVFDRFTAALH